MAPPPSHSHPRRGGSPAPRGLWREDFPAMDCARLPPPLRFIRKNVALQASDCERRGQLRRRPNATRRAAPQRRGEVALGAPRGRWCAGILPAAATPAFSSPLYTSGVQAHA
eukprot:142804-Chlamydomonas_euryale.AAC.2